jgi:hypothetical protein
MNSINVRYGSALYNHTTVQVPYHTVISRSRGDFISHIHRLALICYFARRLAAHLDSTIRRLHSYLQYIGLMRYKKAADMLLRLQEYNLAWRFPNWKPCLFFFAWPPWQRFPILCQHCYMCTHCILSTSKISNTQLYRGHVHMSASPPPE